MLKETYEKWKENNIYPIVPLFEPKENDLKVYLFGPPPPPEGKKENTEKKNEKENENKDKEKKDDKDKDSNEKGNEKSNYGDNEDIELDYIEQAHTYIYYKLSFSESINPKIPGFGDKIEPTDLKGKIEFRNVTFAYPTKPEIDVLKEVSFIIEPGQSAGLVGYSGCGKSTIIQLIERFYEVYEGNG